MKGLEGLNVLCWVLVACIVLPVAGTILMVLIEIIIGFIQWISNKIRRK